MSLSDPLEGLALVGEALAQERASQAGEPDWLLQARLEAVRSYDAQPVETNQLFTTYLDLRLAHFGALSPYPIVRDAETVDGALPAGTAAFLHVSEDRVVARAVETSARAKGVFLDTFAAALADRPDVLRATLASGAPTLPENDKLAQLARAVSAVNVLVHVPDGVQLKEPIVVRWSVGAAGRALVSRTIVVLGRDAHATVLEEQRSSDEDAPAAQLAGSRMGIDADGAGAQSLWSGTLEVVLGDGATLDIASEGDFGPHTISFVNRHATLGQEATLRWALAHVGGLLARSRVDNWLMGRGSSVQQVEIGFGGAQQLFDLTSYTHHVGRDTTGNLLSKGVFQDRARGFFKGLIEIQKTAVGTDSFLGEFAMLLDRKARSVAIPSLEIDQPDVRRASHSSSVGPIDEGQLFYLESRGVLPDIARKLIVLGFLEPVVARIPLPEAQDRLRELLEDKWRAGREAAAAA